MRENRNRPPDIPVELRCLGDEAMRSLVLPLPGLSPTPCRV